MTTSPGEPDPVPPRPDGAPPPPPQPPPLPGYAPGQQPVGGHPHPGQRPFAHGPLGALAQGATWRTALVPAGIALLAGVIVSIVLSVLLTSLTDLSSMTEEFGMGGGAIGYALPFILLALALGGSGVVRVNAGFDGVVGLDGAMHIAGAPLLISIVTVGLLWWLTKRSEARGPSPHRTGTWMRIGI